MLHIIPVLLFIAAATFPACCFTAYVMDVKQGSSTFIKLTEKSGVLIDAGPVEAAPHIIQYLKDRRIDTIKMAILSHPDVAHIGGFEKIIQSRKFIIRQVIKNKDKSTERAYKTLLAIMKRKKIRVLTLERDTIIRGVEIKNAGATGGSLDHRSLVVCYSELGKSIVVMGDADAKAEKSLLPMKADALVISHHGSATATSKEFLDSVWPEMVLISVGKNGYRHPTATVLNRLKDKEIYYYRTDKMGDIEVAVIDWALKINGSKSNQK